GREDRDRHARRRRATRRLARGEAAGERRRAPRGGSRAGVDRGLSEARSTRRARAVDGPPDEQAAVGPLGGRPGNHGGCGERSGGCERRARSSLLRRPTPAARPARRTSSVVAALAALAPGSFASLTMITRTDS